VTVTACRVTLGIRNPALLCVKRAKLLRWHFAGKPAASVSQRGSTTEASTAVSAEAGLQAAVWTRLLILMPLLPLVYADREPKAELNLRTALVRATARWAQCQAASPAFRRNYLFLVMVRMACVTLAVRAARLMGACLCCANAGWPSVSPPLGSPTDYAYVLMSGAEQRGCHD